MDWARATRVSAPIDPISLGEAREWLRVDGTAEDYHILTALRAAADNLEGPNGAGIALSPTQWDYTLDSFPREIRIGLVPLISVDSITYTDTAGASQTFAASDYEVSLQRGLIRPVATASWPGTDSAYDAVTIRFTAGYNDLPGDLQMAVQLLMAHYFENREATGMRLEELPFGVRTIIERYRQGRFG